MKFLNAIRAASKYLKPQEFTQAVERIRISKSGVQSIDKVFETLPFKHINGEVHINGVKLRDLHVHLRLGNILKFMEEAKIPTNITRSEENAFKELLKTKIPDLKLDQMRMVRDEVKLVHGDLHIQPPSSGAELEAALKPATKIKLTSMWNSLKRYASATGAITGVLGSIIIGANMYEDLVRATNERNGCFIMQQIDDKTLACKIANRSCDPQQTAVAKNITQCNTKELGFVKLNLHVFVKNALQNDKKDSLEKINAALAATESSKDKSTATTNTTINTTTTTTAAAATPVQLTADNVNEILSNAKYVQVLQQVYETYDGLEAVEPCAVVGKSTNCVACDSYAPINSIEYVDDSKLPSNYSIKCVTDSTILDTLVDVALNTGANIFDTTKASISGGGSPYIKYIVIFMIVLLILFTIVNVYSHLKKPDSYALN